MLVLRKAIEAEYFNKRPLFKTKQEYLLFVKNWKGSIRYVEHHIRLYKKALHKEAKQTDGYKLFIREHGNDTFYTSECTRDERIWRNWCSRNQFELSQLQHLATEMYQLRRDMKQISWTLRQRPLAQTG
jgi:hypothetical protein